MDLCFLGCLLDAAQFLWIVLEVVPKAFVPFRESVTDSGGSVSCDTQPNCRASFTIATALSSPPFFGFLLVCSSTFQWGNEHSLPNYCGRTFRDPYGFQFGWIRFILLSRFFHTHPCGFTGFQDTRKFRPELISVATGLTMLTCLACLARHSRSHWRFQFLASILDGFFEFLVLRVNEINSS